ncbi:MAG: nickel-dependent lactate racemase, partial [Cyclobacteriaceae bacterium]|nr:nickel-dependent lactate racemase [Cyclobacteriaceae bacterium]
MAKNSKNYLKVDLMQINLKYGRENIPVNVPDNSIIYNSKYPANIQSAKELLQDALANPSQNYFLGEALYKRREGKFVIVVSDITRPVPYKLFLPLLLQEIEKADVNREEILILIATGMHRVSSLSERIEMFGEEIVNNYNIIDHNAKDVSNLKTLDELSWSGLPVSLNRHYMEAGFRIVSGLVEPHFMAGFSGGRKSICPGIASLDAVRNFHGFDFLDHPNAKTACLIDNPLHEEALSVAHLAPADYAVQIVLDQQKAVNHIICGDLFHAHQEAVEYVKACCCPVVEKEADLVLTSSGGYPLDATFYQCVKGIVNTLPAVKENGTIICMGSCSEGIGSEEYAETMKKYSGRSEEFLRDISEGAGFIKDQWQLQMHIRALRKLGQEHIHFFTSGIEQEELRSLSVHPHASNKNEIQKEVQMLIDRCVEDKGVIAVLPEGPYCSPISEDSL